MAELVTLPGVGRKTANVILGNAFDIPASPSTTHFGRLVRRWQWTAETDLVKGRVRRRGAYRAQRVDVTESSRHFHGRRVCGARKPACGSCVLAGTAVLRHWPHRTDDRRRTGPRTRDRTPARPGRSVARCARRPAGRWRLAALGAPSVVAFALELTGNPDRSGAPQDPVRRTHRDADTAEALAGPRQRAPTCRRARLTDRDLVPNGCVGVEVEVRRRRFPGRRRACPGQSRGALNPWAYWCGPCAERNCPPCREYQRRVGDAGERHHRASGRERDRGVGADGRTRRAPAGPAQDGRRSVARRFLQVPNVMPATVVLRKEVAWRRCCLALHQRRRDRRGGGRGRHSR